MERFSGRKIFVAGLARSGEAAARLAVSRGARVLAADSSDSDETRIRVRRLGKLGIDARSGSHGCELLSQAELVVTSPGLKDSAPVLKEAKRRGIPVISEIELAWRFCACPVIAVTGTNGKSTVTTLIGDMLQQAGRRAVTCGNIGNSFSAEMLARPDAEIFVVEVSSFQLLRVDRFRPAVAVVLNLTRNHLDYHRTMLAYTRAKFRIFARQRATDWAVVNIADARLRRKAGQIFARRLVYALDKSAINRSDFHAAAWLENGMIMLHNGKSAVPVIDAGKIRLKGRHNLENIMAAVLAVRSQGVDPAASAATAAAFCGLEHRCESVGRFRQVEYVNDSKSTTVDATIRALAGFPDKSVILICGGRDKGNDYSSCEEPVRRKVRGLILIGEAADRIQKCLAHETAFCRKSPSLEAAVKQAADRARVGDTVLFSPMCASFDMFTDFEQRGKMFKKLVKRIVKQ